MPSAGLGQPQGWVFILGSIGATPREILLDDGDDPAKVDAELDALIEEIEKRKKLSAN